MSFQGDVAGIGLGELLQGLSRGGRDGVLTLFGDDATAALGLHGGQLFLLAGPDEDEETWRERAHRAFAERQDANLEVQRRETIARAERLQTMYLMLEAANLHFRFEPGPLPVPPGFSSPPSTSLSLDSGQPAFDPRNSPWGPGFTVEYLLLEHARISDESKSGAAATLSGYDLPRAYDAGGEMSPEVRDFLEECDGTSTVQEIADRLGWTLLRCKNSVGRHVQEGALRIAQPRELLAGAQRELELGRIGRAAVRLAGWVETSPPGPPSVGDADLLVGEWESGRLSHLLHALEPSVGRALLRKLDRVHLDQRAARDRWHALHDAHKGDEIAMLHEVALRLVATEEPEARTFNELLRLARAFQEREQPARTRTMLRLAAGHLPQRPRVRIELGRRMLETGLVDEGTRWLLNTAHQLIESGDPETALLPIRAVLREVPDHDEAGSLQIHAQTLCKHKKRRKVTLAISGAVVVLIAMVALVQYRSHREVEHWLTEIKAYVGRPSEALAVLDQQFGTAPPARIEEERQRLIALKMQAENAAYDKWLESYREAEQACADGDPLLGLDRTLELAVPPTMDPDSESFPERQDLLGALAARLGERSAELDLPATASIEELNAEERLLHLLAELGAKIEPERAAPEVVSFHFRLTEMVKEIEARRARRAEEREVLIAKDKNQQAEILLGVARAHAEAGDLERSLAAYDRLLGTDEDLGKLPTLATEIDEVRRHFEGAQAALALAEAGDHEAAIEELREVCKKPIEHLLPFQVVTRPAGVRVTLPDGRVRTTPFQARSAVGESLVLRFSAAGFQDATVALERPRNVEVEMYKLPEREWESEHRIEAVPVPAGDDHVVADRYGNLLRLDDASEPRWRRDLRTLGGVARTPVFLPGRPGQLLVLSEDGKAWLVDAANGDVEGPHDIGSPPISGPVLTRSGVSASFADKRIGVWTDALEPVYFQDESLIPTEHADDEAVASNLVVLRRGIDRGRELVSPWNSWRAVVREQEVRVLAPDDRGFAVELRGDWMFVAWESPKALVPHGRLWVSDDTGLRSYLPEVDMLVDYSEARR